MKTQKMILACIIGIQFQKTVVWYILSDKVPFIKIKYLNCDMCCCNQIWMPV